MHNGIHPQRVTFPARRAIGCVVAALAALIPCSYAPAAEAPDLQPLLERASDFEACDAWSEGVSVLKPAYDAGSRDPELLKSLGVLTLKSGQAAAASEYFAAARAASPADVEPIFWSAVAASAAGDDSKASALLAEGLAAAGENEVALYDLAEKLLRRCAVSAAVSLYRKINAICPSDSQFDLFSALNLATYYGSEGRDAEAAALLSSYRRAFEYSDVTVLTSQECDYLVAWFRGRAAAAAGDTDGAAAILRDAALAYRTGVIADGELVRVLDAAGRTEEADGVYSICIRRFKERLASSPEDHAACFDLALFVATSLRKDAAGLDACEWALRLAPLRPEYLGLKAALLSNLGRYEDALAPVQRTMVLVTAPRWVEPGQYVEWALLRLEILKKTGRPLPDAFTRLPEPETPPAKE